MSKRLACFAVVAAFAATPVLAQDVDVDVERHEEEAMEMETEAEMQPAEEMRVDVAPGVDVDVEVQETEMEAAPRAAARAEARTGDALFTEFGTALYVGGGVTGFTQSGVTDNTSPGGYWDVRGVAGTRSIIGAELGYHGSAQDIDALGLEGNSFLLGNGVDAALRLQAPITQAMIDAEALGDTPLFITPYAFGGVGWTRYDVLEEGTNTSSVQDVDNILDIPLGVGLGAGIGGLSLDARFTYRQTFFSELVGDATSSFDDVALNNWNVGASIGFEF